MKKIGEYTVRGVVKHNETDRVTLFDGKFNTGYRIKEIHTIPATYDATADGSIIAHTEETIQALPDFSDNTQVAWASYSFDVNFGTSASHSLVDPDNMIVEDIYISAFSNNSARSMNYMLILEKYDISEWQGALTMVRNRSQG
jgi:hypothetical protein